MPFLLSIEFVGFRSTHNTRTHTRTCHTIKKAAGLRAHTKRMEKGNADAQQSRSLCYNAAASCQKAMPLMLSESAVVTHHCAVTKQNRSMHILSQSVPNCALVLHPRPIEAGHAMTTDCPRQTINKQACHSYLCSPRQGSVPCVCPVSGHPHSPCAAARLRTCLS
jgi:hypothetical protein